jgi:hypothetical protein
VKFQVEPDDPWYVDPTDTRAVVTYVLQHCECSQMCTHGKGFTYDFCPIANGNLKLALEALK